jgi:nitrogen regulatory protein P-II 1
MYLLVDVLEQTEHLASLLEGLAKIGVTGATVLDSIGMGRILLESGAAVPSISVIKEVLVKGKPTNKTIFAVIRDKETLQKSIDLVRSLCGDLNEPGKGILFTLPLDFVEGLKAAH